MNALRNVAKCDKVSYRETLDNAEALKGVTSSDEHGYLISYNVRLIIKNYETIAEQRAARMPSAKVITKAEQNIKNCMETIKVRMSRLGASSDEIANVIKDIEDMNVQGVTQKVLYAMARKNPGLHARKYKEFLAMTEAKKQAITQPQR